MTIETVSRALIWKMYFWKSEYLNWKEMTILSFSQDQGFRGREQDFVYKSNYPSIFGYNSILQQQIPYCSANFSNNLGNVVMSYKNYCEAIKLQYSDGAKPVFLSVALCSNCLCTLQSWIKFKLANFKNLVIKTALFPCFIQISENASLIFLGSQG